MQQENLHQVRVFSSMAHDAYALPYGTLLVNGAKMNGKYILKVFIRKSLELNIFSLIFLIFLFRFIFMYNVHIHHKKRSGRHAIFCINLM